MRLPGSSTSQEPLQRPVGLDGAHWDGRRPLVLIVDDQDTNRDVLARRLNRRGYDTRDASGGEQALQMIHAQDFDLILLDVMMPGMSGLEVLQQLRKTRSRAELPVIMVTARDQSSDVVEALGLGANDYVTKPIDFAVIMARVETQLSLRNSVRQIIKLERRLSERNIALEGANQHLQEAAERARRELEMAAKVQTSLLPSAAPSFNGVQFAWAFQPCNELAGDALNVGQVGPNHVSFYVLDVSGHGVAASLASVAATRALSPTGNDSMVLMPDGITPVPPAEVLQRMDVQFPFKEETEQFITLFYAVLDTTRRELTYASAGHPGAIRVRADGSTDGLTRSNVPIGLGSGMMIPGSTGLFDQFTVKVEPGDRLYVYSDGMTEASNIEDEEYSRERLISQLQSTQKVSLDDSVRNAIEAVEQWRHGSPVRDDVSLLAAEIH